MLGTWREKSTDLVSGVREDVISHNVLIDTGQALSG